jgi:hypothetical protein
LQYRGGFGESAGERPQAVEETTNLTVRDISISVKSIEKDLQEAR